MRNRWMLLALSALCLLGKEVFVTGQHTLVDDLYLDEQQSGDYSVDDDGEFTSGSGSGYVESDDEDMQTVEKIETIKPTQQSIQTSSPGQENTTFNVPDTRLGSTEAGQQVTGTMKPQGSDEVSSSSSIPDVGLGSGKPNDVQTKTLFQRTEVLAAVIAGGIIGFLFAIFLILLLVYRMRKKDEGSYDLGERKLPSTAYQKAPTKEFYA
ncbi:Syndecan-2-A [Bagarius yarrelli]|uniref:Syndecan n=1 Tax=Bagarius yarrelli TaxID=175774 RepID=A0A556TQ94_BAGYA|nr:Syndecan-2-A [Bagarius yarrelli]